MTANTARPVNLNLFKIHQPITAIVSGLHRLTGVALVLNIPTLIYLFSLSLRDAQGFARVAALLQSPLAKPLLLLAAWFLVHHLLAGMRFLLLDLELGIAKGSARRSAWLVIALEIATMALLGISL